MRKFILYPPYFDWGFNALLNQ